MRDHEYDFINRKIGKKMTIRHYSSKPLLYVYNFTNCNEVIKEYKSLICSIVSFLHVNNLLYYI